MTERPTAPAWVRPLLLLGFALVAARRVYALAVSKGFTLDEFQWAHAAWALAKGQVQYRDFFEVHFPLNYQYMSLAFWASPDDPTTILTMRMMMLPVLALAAWGMWSANSHRGRDWALLAPILAFSLPSFVARAIEIRHDSLAFALVMGAVGFLYVRRGRPRVRAFASGVCLALACWATQKTLIYAVCFFGAAVSDLFRWRRGERGFILVDLPAFLAGSASVVVLICVGLTLRGNWEPFYQWCFAYAGQFQTRQPGFSWFTKLEPMLRYLWWQLPLAVLGALTSARRLREAQDAVHPDQLLLLLWLGSWAAWVLLAVPMSYSAIPFLGITSIFAARGVVTLFETLEGLGKAKQVSPKLFSISLLLLFTLAFVRTGTHLEVDLYPEDRERFDQLQARYYDDHPQNLLGPPDAAAGLPLELPEEPEPAPADARWQALLERPAWAEFEEAQNEYQLRVLKKIGELTAPDDSVYDNSGSYVARPHAYWFYYTYGYFYAFDADLLEREVPDALRESEAVMVVIDSRFKKLPKPLRKHIARHYQPYNGDLWLWGSTFELDESPREPLEFEAIRDDTYFVDPPELLRDGRLSIDGQPVTQRSFELGKGVHQVTYSGPAKDFSLLWQPHNDEQWSPNRGAKRRYCCRNSTR